MNIKTQRYLKIGLSCLNIAGIVGTFIFASKDAVNYQKVKENLPKDAKKKTKVKSFIKSHWRSLIFVGATIASGVGSTLISNKVEASLMATVSMLDASTRKYRKKIKETLGIDADKSIIQGIMKDEYEKSKDNSKSENEKLYYEEHIGYFYAVPEKVKDTLLKLNSEFCDMGTYVYDGGYRLGVYTLGEFLKDCQGRPLSHNLTEDKLNFGWCIDYLYEQWETAWVHIDFSEPDENGAILIYWFEEPIWNPAEWCDYMYGNITTEEYFSRSEDVDIPNINSPLYQKMNSNTL